MEGLNNPFSIYSINHLQQIKDHLTIQLKVIDGTYVGPIDPKTRIRRKPIPMPWMKDKWTKAIELIDQVLIK
ncbi:MAG: hypothetical protein KAY50_00615 [Chitinophagaceae bacterium]|nr:hypothetical protein [Chitinophagaceae bacterium]